MIPANSKLKLHSFFDSQQLQAKGNLPYIIANMFISPYRGFYLFQGRVRYALLLSDQVDVEVVHCLWDVSDLLLSRRFRFRCLALELNMCGLLCYKVAMESVCVYLFSLFYMVIEITNINNTNTRPERMPTISGFL